MVRTEIPSSFAIGPVRSHLFSNIGAGLLNRPSPDQFQNPLKVRLVLANNLKKLLISIRKLLEMALQNLQIHIQTFALGGMNVPAVDAASFHSLESETVPFLGHCQNCE